MISFVNLNKNQKSHYLPLLFDILYSNMKDIAPTDVSYDKQKNEFLTEVSEALEKEPRRIILCYKDNDLAGFMMYYTRHDLLVIEEVQLKKEYQRTRLFSLLCKHMKSILPDSIVQVESYVEKRNSNSLTLQKKLGMEVIDEINDDILHLKGEAKTIKERIR